MRILELLLLGFGDLLAVELGRLLEVEALRELDLEELLVDLLGLVEGGAGHGKAHEHVARRGLARVGHLALQLLLGVALAHSLSTSSKCFWPPRHAFASGRTP